MICPSCNFRSETRTAFCIRCGFSFEKHGAFFAVMRGTFTWILRRSLAGFAAGMAGWCVIAAASRAAGANLSQTAHLLMTGALGGIFLGTVEGMMEESSLKTIRGGLVGLASGFAGAIMGAWIIANVSSSSAGMTAVVSTWAMAGLGIGMASAWMERRIPRLIVGAAAGLFGGALGGWLGYQIYASLMDITRPELWGLKRLIEGAAGGILGAILWFVLGIAEKFYIFKRHPVHNISYKECDACQHSNILKAWYCAACGAVLQASAPPEKLELVRRQALARFISACQFLGRLAATTSFVIAWLALVFLGSISPFLGLFGMLVTSLLGYILFILFNSFADFLSPAL